MCESVHRTPVHVREVLLGGPIWEGTVDTFELIGHLHARMAYAWRERRNDRGHASVSIVVLGLPPIRTAHDAVRTAVVADIQADRQPAQSNAPSDT